MTHPSTSSGLKLATQKGNLDEFKKTHPEAQSFFEFKASKFSFKFPQPSFIEGTATSTLFRCLLLLVVLLLLLLLVLLVLLVLLLLWLWLLLWVVVVVVVVAAFPFGQGTLHASLRTMPACTHRMACPTEGSCLSHTD